MKASRVASRYARALLELADKGNEEKWGAELEQLASIVESPELIDRLSSPELTEQMRQTAMTKIAERLSGLSFPLRSFAAVVARARTNFAISARSPESVSRPARPGDGAGARDADLCNSA